MKFSIRDLLLVTVIVGLIVGWIVSGWRLQAELNRVRKYESRVEALDLAMKRQGWAVTWDAQLEIYELRTLPASSAPATNPPKKSS